jgi:hypothetical protein
MAKTRLTMQDAEWFLDHFECVATESKAGCSRWYAVSAVGEKIVHESIYGILCGCGDEVGVSRPQLLAEVPELLVDWQASQRFYLAAKNDAGVYFVDTAATTREAAESLKLATGGKGKTRSRAEMLTDPEHPGPAQALVAWESGDDSAVPVDRDRWAEHVLATAAEKRAELRWGMIDLPDD